MTTVTFAVFMKGHCGAQTFALDAGWLTLTHMQRDLGLTDQEIEESYFEIDQWPVEYQLLKEHSPYEQIQTVMVMGNPSRAYLGKCFAHVKDALALVPEAEYLSLL